MLLQNGELDAALELGECTFTSMISCPKTGRSSWTNMIGISEQKGQRGSEQAEVCEGD